MVPPSRSPISKELQTLWATKPANSSEAKALSKEMKNILNRALLNSSFDKNDFSLLVSIEKELVMPTGLKCIKGPTSKLVQLVHKASKSLSHTSIHELPVECMLPVMEWLPMCDRLRGRQVNKGFEALLTDSRSLIKYLREGRPITTRELTVVLKLLRKRSVAQKISELNLSQLKDKDVLTDDMLKMISKYCPDLRSVQIPHCSNISDEALVDFSKLQVLNLSGCTKISERGLINLVSRCPDLEVLNLGNCNCITDEALGAFAESLSNRLLFLDISTASDTSHVTNTGLAVIADACPHLTTFYANGQKRIDDTGLARLASTCTELQALSCDAVQAPLNGLLSALTAHNPNLQSLQIGKASFDPSFFLSFIASKPQLYELDLDFSSFKGEDIAAHCHNLRNLTIRNASFTTISASSLAVSCSGLQRLVVMDQKCYFESIFKGDSPLSQFTKLCTNLREFQWHTGTEKDSYVVGLATKSDKIDTIYVKRIAGTPQNVRMIANLMQKNSNIVLKFSNSMIRYEGFCELTGVLSQTTALFLPSNCLDSSLKPEKVQRYVRYPIQTKPTPDDNILIQAFQSIKL